MNEGPFRMPNRAEGNQHDDDRPAEAPQPVREHRVEEPKTRVEEPKRMRHNVKPHLDNEKSYKKPLAVGAAVVAVLAVVILGIWTVLAGLGGSNGIDTSKYQAVFFTNGQVYFGKLHDTNSEYMKLTDIYYLQTQASGEDDTKNPQKTTNDQNNPTLIKLGSEIHGPEDEMIISKDQVLFYENLKKDGKVSQSIEKYKSPN